MIKLTKEKCTLVLSFLFLILILSSMAHAAAGSLDRTFGDGGIVLNDFGRRFERINSLVLQDGKIVVVGYSNDGMTDASMDGTFIVARFNSNGSLDPSFGDGGKVRTSFGATGDGEAMAVALQSDGKIVVAGVVYVVSGGSYGSNFALVRYNSNGGIDARFGTGGKVITRFQGSDIVNDMAIQDDGKIILVGKAENNFAIARYNSDGTLDGSFARGGKIEDDIGGIDEIFAIALHNRKIIVAGISTIGRDSPIVLVRYNLMGWRDGTFGRGRSYGVVRVNLGRYRDVPYDMAIQDNKILITGESDDGFMMARFDDDGMLDGSFGTSGVVNAEFGVFNTIGYCITALENKILVGGQYYITDLALARYNLNGELDTTFGSDGKTITRAGRSVDRVTSMVIQGDGKIVLAGSAFSEDSSHGSDFFVARYYGDSSNENSIVNNYFRRADLALSMGVVETIVPPSVGEPLRYRATITNNGPGFAVKTVFTSRFHGTVTFDSASSSKGVCIKKGDQPTSCQLGTLASGDIETVDIVIRPTHSGSLPHLGSVTTDSTDNNSDNNNIHMYTNIR